MRGLLNAFIGPTSVYSALSSSDFWISGNSKPFPGGRRRLYCYNVSLDLKPDTYGKEIEKRAFSSGYGRERFP